MNTVVDDFISPYEAEHLIQELKDIDLKEYGSKQWFKQHEVMDRLNIQAHKNAMHSTDEFVMEAFCTHDKIPSLVNDLLTAEVWMTKIFPLIKKDVALLSSVKSYLCLYHEASIVNLLEVMLYHRTACESSEDALVEVIDYCYRKFVHMTSQGDKYVKRQTQNAAPLNAKELGARTPVDDLDRQTEEIQFNCTMISFSLIRFISDHINELSVPIVHQMMEANDIPCVLVPLIELKPWLRKNVKGETEKFEDQKWAVVPVSESNKVSKIEAQIWLTIYNMFACQDTNRKYEITSFRKQNLLRLRKYLNESLLDQLPMLGGMLRGLEEMSMMGDSGPAQNNSFIVQQLPEMRERIMRGRDYNAIAKYQMDNFFNSDANDPEADMKSLMNLYGSDVFDQFMEEPKCADCGEPAKQRCSKCKGEWYCSRECQLKKWKEHKKMCKMLEEMHNSEQERAADVKKMNAKLGKKEEETEHEPDFGQNTINQARKESKRPMIEELD